MFTGAKNRVWCAYLAILQHVGGAHESYLHTFCLLENNKHQRWRKDQTHGQTVSLLSALPLKCAKKKVSCHLVSLLYTVYGTRYYFSTNSSSHAHSERALKYAGFGRKLVFAGSEVGNESSRACNNWEEPPWRQRTLQARDVKSVPSKRQTFLMESGHWCSSGNARTRSCLENTNKVLQLLHRYWYVSVCLELGISVSH